MFPFCSACPFPDPVMCTCAQVCSHWNIQTNKCLFGWCEAFVCAHLHLKQQKQNLENNTNGIKIGSDDVVINPMHTCI